MTVTIRYAIESDLDAVAKLTAQHRARLAGWAPRWWKPSEAADQIHPYWLQHLITSDGPIVRVAADSDNVIGCAVSMPQESRWFIDDFAVATDRWRDAGIALIGAIDERPALTCTASQDAARLKILNDRGLAHVSSYWIRGTEAGHADIQPVDIGAPLPDPPVHTFGAAIDPRADGALTFTHRDGMIIGSPSIPAPPVYDPDGTVCVIDRVVDVTDELIRAAIATAGQRGDVLINIIAAAEDELLQRRLGDNGFTRTVDVHRWP